MTDRARLDQRQIAELLGVGLQTVKKWRGATRRTLIKAGQLDWVAPTVPLPKSALPIPRNQAEHVRDRVDPRCLDAVLLSVHHQVRPATR